MVVAGIVFIAMLHRKHRIYGEHYAKEDFRIAFFS